MVSHQCAFKKQLVPDYSSSGKLLLIHHEQQYVHILS